MGTGTLETSLCHVRDVSKKPPCNVDVSLLEDFGLALQMKLQQICVETAQGISCEHRQRKASSVSGVARALTG